MGSQDIERVILATRHRNESLFPVSSWPMFVHVARLLREPRRGDTLPAVDLEEIGWGELYPTEEEARKAANREP
jgi:hypothetical protein